jgi:hypothetical protein
MKRAVDRLQALSIAIMNLQFKWKIKSNCLIDLRTSNPDNPSSADAHDNI